MDTLTFLQTILPEEGFKFVGLSRVGHIGIAHKAYESLELMAKAIESYNAQPNLTVYHACCSYVAPSYEVIVEGIAKTKYRGEPNWHKAKAFWADIDCGQSKHDEGKGYLTKTDAVKAVLRFCHANQFPNPMFVDSGGGVHCYWPLTRTIGPKSWRQMSSTLKSVLHSASLLIDPTRTADLSSILRPVGSTNRKPNREAKEVKVLIETKAVDPKDFLVALNKLVEKYGAPTHSPSSFQSSGLNDDLLAHVGPSIECSADEVANHCQQVGKMRDTKGDVDYESWRGIIGIIKHCVEGYDTAVDWSSQRAATGHSQTDVLTRYETWSSGPATCEFFKKCNPEGCAGCVHDGKVKSPIVLGRIVPEPQEEVVTVVTEEAEEVETTVPPMPEGYEYQGRMIRYIKDKDGINQPYSFSQSLFYPIQRIRKSDGSFAFTIRMHLPDKRVRDFEVDTASLASSSDMLKALSKYELMPTNNKDATMHMTAYIRDSVHKLMAEQRETDTLTSFGWRDDMSGFLLGDRLYHSDGSVRKVFIGGGAADHRASYPMPRGTLAEYTKAVNFIYNRPNSEAAQYVFCNVYGSLLTPFGEDSYNGALVSINSGDSGKGKTSVWRSALYGLADANKLIYAGKDGATRNARWAIVGVHKNIPVVFDEMTDMDAAELSTFAYTVSQGTDRARLTSQGGRVGFAEQHSWKAVVGVTANEDMHSKLASHNANTQAEAVRMIGINFAKYNVPIIDPSKLVSDAIDVMRENLGNAGDIFVRYIVTHQTEVADLYAKTENKLSTLLPESEYRFFRSHAACTLTAARILIDLGVVDFNYEALVEFSARMLTDLISTVTTNNMTNPNDAISRMIREMSQRVVVTYEYRDLRTDARGPEDSISRPMGTVAGRRVLGSKTYTDSKYVGRLFIAKKEFLDWCSKNRTEPKALMEFAQNQNWIIPWTDKFNMGRGTAYSTGSCNCIVFDYAAMEGAVEKTSGPIVNNVKEIMVASQS